MKTNSLSHARKLPRPKPAFQIIYEHLLNSIISGEIDEGRRIVESDLAKMFGVSRSPVREALKLLEIDGFIELIPYRGVVVTRIEIQDVQENMEIKGMVEGFAAGICARKSDQKVIGQLEAILNDLERHISAGKLQRVLETNINFHYSIVESAKNEKLLKYYTTLTHSIRRFYTINLAIADGWEFSLNEHREILESIKAGDSLAAEQAARRHALNSESRLLDRLGKKLRGISHGVPQR